jgi:hypothetical protein
MAAGMRFVVLFYPGFIGLKVPVSFELRVSGKPVLLNAVKHISALEILDFDNALTATPMGNGEHVSLRTPIAGLSNKTLHIRYGDFAPWLVDYARVHYRLFKPRPFTELHFAYEIPEIAAITEEELNFHNSVLAHFLAAYRFTTNDVKVRLPSDLQSDVPLVMEAITQFSEAELAMDSVRRLQLPRQVMPGIKQFSISEYQDLLPTVPHDMSRATDALTRFLDADRSIPPVRAMLVKAFEELTRHKNQRYALLEAFIAAEAEVVAFWEAGAVRRGVSKKKLDALRDRITVSQLLSVQLFLLFDQVTDEDRQIVARVDAVRTLRNRVVHENASVSDQQALDAINSVSALVALLERKRQGWTATTPSPAK